MIFRCGRKQEEEVRRRREQGRKGTMAISKLRTEMEQEWKRQVSGEKLEAKIFLLIWQLSRSSCHGLELPPAWMESMFPSN
jgi:hypothetical protein